MARSGPKHITFTPGEASILDIERVYQVCARRCLGTPIRLEWNQIGTASTNGKTISLPVPKLPVAREDLDKLYGLVIHETGHLARPQAFRILAKAKPKESLRSCFNMCEDFAMERDQARYFAGDAKALGIMARDLFRQFYRDGKEKYTKACEVNPDLINALACLLLQAQAQLATWDVWSSAAYTSMESVFPKEVLDLKQTLIDEGWLAKLIATSTPSTVWEYTCDLHNRLYPKDTAETEERRVEGLGQGDPTGAEGEGEAGGEGDSEGADPSKSGGKPKQASKGDLITISWKDIVKSHHDQVTPEGATGGVNIDWTGKKGWGHVALAPHKDIRVTDCTNATGDDAGKYMSKCYRADVAGAAGMANRMRVYLQARAKTFPEREKLTGRLDKRSIVRLVLPPIDGGEYNKKVFYQQAEKKELNTSCLVLVDWSGSMAGKKEQYAADAAGRLVSMFDTVLGIPSCVAAFTYNGGSSYECEIGLIKDFNHKSNVDKMANGFAKFRRKMAGNNDADALNWAYRKLLARQEDRRILIVLSDGAPTDGMDGVDPYLSLRHLTADIEREQKIELWGVGIKSPEVQTFYKKHVVVHELEEINNCLFDIIKSGVK